MPGKNNTAVFNSTDGNDLLLASYLGAQFITPSYEYDAWNFSNIQGVGGSGDEARFYGSPGGDTVLNVTPTGATQTESNLTLAGTGYGTFTSYVYPGDKRPVRALLRQPRRDELVFRFKLITEIDIEKRERANEPDAQDKNNHHHFNESETFLIS